MAAIFSVEVGNGMRKKQGVSVQGAEKSMTFMSIEEANIPDSTKSASWNSILILQFSKEISGE
jgi:hypothetical protein